LDWRTPVDGGKWGSPHSLDVPLVFDNVARSSAMLGTGPAPQLIADQMSAAWIAFARTGKPDTTGLPPWPPFTLAQRATMVFDTTPRIVNDYRGQERAMLASLPLYRVLR
ncbi:MAG TPA: carboxylesterase family protein, partial [Rhodopila sp.]|nr:carboxylesterase family protein [Rhodopila sp.]